MLKIAIVIAIIVFGLVCMLVGGIVMYKLFSTDYQGPQGIQGPPGPMGLRGPSGYNPVKGLDYFTEEDKQELIKRILKELEVKE